MSIAFLSAVHVFFRQQVFVGLIRAGEVEMGSLGIEDEDAVFIERNFSGLPGALFTVLGDEGRIRLPNRSY